MSEFEGFHSKEIFLEVMKLDGVDTFIYMVNGKVTIPALLDIEKQLLEYEQELLDRGDGYYKLSCSWNNGEYTDYGQCVYPPYWDLYVDDYKKLEEEYLDV